MESTVNTQEKIKALWRKTFGDSKEYVDLVFDNYYNPRYAKTIFDGDTLVSALIGIEYHFRCIGHELRALYLCGLATEPSYRNRGYMGKLIKEIEKTAREDGFAFTFLIPASDELKDYYKFHDYQEAIYRISLSYTPMHDFGKEYHNILDKGNTRVAGIKKRQFDSLSYIRENLYEGEWKRRVVDYVLSQESRNKNVCLVHNEKDINILIEENRISKGEIVAISGNGEELSGVAFIDTSRSKNTVYILKLFYSNHCSRFKLLDIIKKKYQDQGIVILSHPKNYRAASLWEREYVAEKRTESSFTYLTGVEERFSANMLAKPYGMINILDLSEILKFEAMIFPSFKFTILVKHDENSDLTLYHANQGKLTIKTIDKHKYKFMQSREDLPLSLSDKDVRTILCRKPDNDKLILETFGLHSLNLEMYLMLD